MTALRDLTPLIGIWQQHRPFILQLGHALWQAMPDEAPPVTVHGRDLRSETEGIGFQFQLAIHDALYDGRIRAAYYVIQLQLTRGRVSLGWLVDAMPALEIAANDYELFPKRTTALLLRQRTELEQLFTTTLRDDARAFFEAVRAGRPMREPALTVNAGTRQSEMPGSA